MLAVNMQVKWAPAEDGPHKTIAIFYFIYG